MKAEKTKQPTTIQALDHEIAKVKKQLEIVETTKRTLNEKLNKLLHEKKEIQVDELVGLRFTNCSGKPYIVTSVNITDNNYEIVHYANLKKNGTAGLLDLSQPKLFFVEKIERGIYSKI